MAAIGTERARWPWVGGGLACAGLLVLLHAANRLDPDEGVVLNGAWNVLHGRVPYVDFFEIVPPGAFYLVAGAWALAGAHFWVAKLLGIAAIGAGALAVFLTGRMLARHHGQAASPWALLAGPVLYCGLSGSWPAINHNTFNAACLAGSACCLAAAVLQRSARLALAGGGLAGLAALFLLHRTLALVLPAAAVLGWLAWRGRGAAGWKVLAAFLVPAALGPALLLLGWPAAVLWEQLVVFPATRYQPVNRVDPTLLVMACTVAAVVILQAARYRSAAWALLAAVQAAMLLAALPRPDLAHVSMALFPLLALLPLQVAAAERGSGASRALLAYALAALVAPTALLGLALRGQFLVDVPASSPAVRYVRERCGGSPLLHAGPFAPGLYYETGKLSATRYSILLTDFNTPAQFAEARRSLASAKPPCAITDFARAARFGHSPANPVDELLAGRYAAVLREGSREVLAIRPER